MLLKYDGQKRIIDMVQLGSRVTTLFCYDSSNRQKAFSVVVVAQQYTYFRKTKKKVGLTQILEKRISFESFTILAEHGFGTRNRNMTHTSD
jgi:hypothetical protein